MLPIAWSFSRIARNEIATRIVQSEGRKYCIFNHVFSTSIANTDAIDTLTRAATYARIAKENHRMRAKRGGE